MISKYTYKKLAWVDLESPSREEILHLADQFPVPQSVLEELTSPTIRSKVDLYADVIYLVLHFPAINHRHHKTTEVEVDFVIGRDFVVSTHYEHSDALHEFAKSFEVSSLLEKANIGDHAGYLFFHIIKHLYKNSLNELEEINGTMREIENNIFDGQEKDMLLAISHTKRKLVDFKRAIRYHRDVLRSFEVAGKHLFGESFAYHLTAITGEFNKVESALEAHREMLNDLRETNDSLLAHKTRVIMKTLTMMSFLFYPIMLVAAIFTMRTGLPLIGQQYDFFYVVGIMLAVMLVMLTIFKG